MALLRSTLMVHLKCTRLFKPSDAYKRCIRKISVKTPLQYAYDSDGKTFVDVLNNQEGAPIMINGYSMFGFRLNNGIFIVGPVALFPNSALSWNIEDDLDINEKSLSLFLHLAPKLDVLIIGMSDPRNQKVIQDTRKNVYDIMRKLPTGSQTSIEVLPTEKAVSTFNFLNSEKRFVAAALVPPTFYSPTLDDQYRVEYLSKKQDYIDPLLPELK